MNEKKKGLNVECQFSIRFCFLKFLSVSERTLNFMTNTASGREKTN